MGHFTKYSKLQLAREGGASDSRNDARRGLALYRRSGGHISRLRTSYFLITYQIHCAAGRMITPYWVPKLTYLPRYLGFHVEVVNCWVARQLGESIVSIQGMYVMCLVSLPVFPIVRCMLYVSNTPTSNPTLPARRATRHSATLNALS